MGISVSLIFLFAYTNLESLGQALVFSFPYISLVVSTTILAAAYFGETPVWGKDNKAKRNYNSDGPFSYLVLSIIFLPASLFYLRLSIIAASFLFSTFLILFLVFLRLMKGYKT
jgi:cobalamin synthase